MLSLIRAEEKDAADQGDHNGDNNRLLEDAVLFGVLSVEVAPPFVCLGFHPLIGGELCFIIVTIGDDTVIVIL